MADYYRPIMLILACCVLSVWVNPAAADDPIWTTLAEGNATEDRKSIIFDGRTPNKLACDTTLRRMPDGSWVMIMLGGGDTEPLPANRIFLTRSQDEGRTWSRLQPVDLGVKAKNANTALCPSELMVQDDRCTMFVATHDGSFANWKEWRTHSDDSCRTWSKLEPAPGRLHDRTFVRNHIVTSDGRILLPFQHYLRVAETRNINKGRRFSPPTNPRNGVLMSRDGGKTWTEHGNIRISRDDNYHGWAENNIVEMSDGRIAMIIRADRLGGVLYYAESKDGGRTWPEFARETRVPNPGSKATLYPLGGDRVALLHNPNPRHRSPLALWISFDGMQTWPYQRILVPESIDGSKGRLNYPDGFVSEDKRYLHFAFDDNRHRAVYFGARLPAGPITNSLGMQLAYIPAGKFGMGSPKSEVGRETQEKRHEVELTKDFYFGVHEVTVGQFRQFVRDAKYKTEAERDGQGSWGIASKGRFERDAKYNWTSPGFEQADDHPVVDVSWNDAKAFCQWLSKKEQKTYRLPTEAEWEYACRAGTRWAYAFGDDPQILVTSGNAADATAREKFSAWSLGIKGEDGYAFTAPVGQFKPNRFGLFDMHGNVWEWCEDWFDPSGYLGRRQTDPKGSASGERKVHRGGGWSSAPEDVDRHPESDATIQPIEVVTSVFVWCLSESGSR